MPGAHRRSSAGAVPGLLALRLAALTVGVLTDVDTCEPIEVGVGNPSEAEGSSNRKRKSAAAPRAHWGLPTDSAARLYLIALSIIGAPLRRQPKVLIVSGPA